MWYNPILIKKGKLEKAVEKEREQRIKELREILAPLRQQLQYLASYRASQYRQPYRKFN